jgi:hypothetical protein
MPKENLSQLAAPPADAQSPMSIKERVRFDVNYKKYVADTIMTGETPLSKDDFIKQYRS